jgi:sigma-B regulation protein RsbU (phosphoserine phosphatase)
MELRTGDTLLITTDGVTDAMNFQQERFGKQRLEQTFIAGGATGGAEVVAQNLLWELRKFVGIAPPTDDITLITARVL